MKLKFAFILTTFLLAANISNADYTRLHLFQVIEMSDIAAVGTIVNVNTETFTIEIEKLLYGDCKEKTISIVKFANWECHHRYKKYEVGQREIVFTKKSNDFVYPFEYFSDGAGNECEIEIIGDSALVLDRSRIVTKYEVNGFCSAIVDYHSNIDNIDNFFKKELEKYFEPFDNNIIDTVKITNQYIDDFENQSIVHNELITGKRNSFVTRVMYCFGENGCKDIKFETDIYKTLFRDHENKVKIDVMGYNIDSVNIFSSECEIIRNGNEFFVKPIKGKKTKLYLIYKYNNKTDTIRQSDFYIEKLRQPTIDNDIFMDFRKYKGYPWGHLSVSYGKFGDWSRFYKILSFDLDIISKMEKITLNSASSRITNEMKLKIHESDLNDNFVVYNIKAIDEDGVIINIEPVRFKLDD